MLNYAATTTTRDIPTMPQLDPRWLSPEDAGDAIGVSRVTVFRMLKDGRLAGVKLYRPHHRALYLWQPDLEAWIERRTAAAQGGEESGK